MNKKIILITMLSIIFLIGGVTAYKVIKKHNDNLLLVSKKYIEEKARDCFNNKKCQGDKVTLETLYNLAYLAKQANPVTKEYYNVDSYVSKDGENYTFTIVS